MTYSNNRSRFLKYNPINPVNVPKPLTDNWRQWVAENKLLGEPDSSLIDILIRHGMDGAAAQAEVQAVVFHPYFRASQNFVQALAKLQSHLDVYTKLAQLSPQLRQVERRDKLSREEFLENYYAKNIPVILTNLMDNWSALSLWDPNYLREKYGDVKVEIQADRNSDPRYELNSNQHKCQVLMREFVDRIIGGGSTNDYYLVANNQALDREELRSLLDDIEIFPEYLDSTDTVGKIFFWFGPSSTVTPLHHDPCNLMLAQVYGRKHWRLISPNQTHLLYNYTGVFSEVDCENPDYNEHPLFKDVSIIEVILEPGEVIFVPVGWWHHVKSLDVSISVSFTNFVFPNTYDWKLPSIQR